MKDSSLVHYFVGTDTQFWWMRRFSFPKKHHTFIYMCRSNYVSQTKQENTCLALTYKCTTLTIRTVEKMKSFSHGNVSISFEKTKTRRYETVQNKSVRSKGVDYKSSTASSDG